MRERGRRSVDGATILLFGAIILICAAVFLYLAHGVPTADFIPVHGMATETPATPRP